VIGNNQIVLNGATMVSYVQRHLDDVVYAKGQSPKVVSVCQLSDTTFRVSVTDRQKETGTK
jgi:hypothetical protein